MSSCLSLTLVSLYESGLVTNTETLTVHNSWMDHVDITSSLHNNDYTHTIKLITVNQFLTHSPLDHKCGQQHDNNRIRDTMGGDDNIGWV